MDTHESNVYNKNEGADLSEPGAWLENWSKSILEEILCRSTIQLLNFQVARIFFELEIGVTPRTFPHPENLNL